MNYDDEVNNIHDDMLNEMPSSYSKIKGSWLWEILKAVAIKIYELLGLLNDTSQKLNIENLKGDELDAYVGQWTDIIRKQAQRASGYIEVVGEGVLYAGSIVAADTIQYEVVADVEIKGRAIAPIVAINAGASSNVEANKITKMVTSNTNVASITNLEPVEGGSDEESDDALRSRYYFRLSMPATSGNKAHYIMWATECIGVGGAKVVRDNNISNKVNLYICGNNGGIADKTTIDLVQNYIDPNINGDGSGVAPIGAICEVFNAKIKLIDVSGIIELNNTQDANETIYNIKAAITSYLNSINFQKFEVSYAMLLHIALSCEGVYDIRNFKINGGYDNIVCDDTQIFNLNEIDMRIE